MATVPDSSKNSPVLVDPHIPSFSTGMQTIVGGEGIVVDDTDPYNPIVSINVNILDMLDNMVLELVEGANVTIDNSDPQRPIISATGGGGGGTGIVESVDAGTGIDVDGTDPTAPVVSLSQETLDTLALAESALQSSDVGSAAFSDATDFATTTQGSKADSAVQPGDLATVATTGSYNDLSNKPSIPAAQVQTDWNAVSGIASIANKPALGSAAYANTSAFATAAQGSLAASAVQPARSISAGTGLTGGGNLSANRTISLSSGTQAAIALADTSLQPSDIGTFIQGFSTNLSLIAGLTLSGNAGKVVKVNTTGDGFVLEDAGGGGGFVPVGTPINITSSVAAVDILLPAGYAEFEIRIRNLKGAAHGQLLARLSADDGASWITSSTYKTSAINYSSTGGSVSPVGSNTSTSIILTNGIINATGSGYSGCISIANPRSSKLFEMYHQGVYWDGNSAAIAAIFGAAALGEDWPINAVRLYLGTGNMTEGQIQLYGLVNGS